MTMIMLQMVNKADTPGCQFYHTQAMTSKPLHLFADELLIMPTAATGLQQRLDA